MDFKHFDKFLLWLLMDVKEKNFMKKRSPLLRLLALIGCIIAGTILMGMVKAPQPNYFATEFNNILQTIPQKGQNIVSLRNGLSTVNGLLINNQFSVALNVLENLQFTLKNMEITTDLGTYSGETIIDMYFGSLMKNLRDYIKDSARKPSTATQPVPLGISHPLASQPPVGLVNTQNSCFMNASIQSMVSLGKLSSVLLKHAHDDFYKPGSAAAAYINLLNTMQNQKGSVIDPLPFCLLAWRWFAPEAMGNQQDAAEFVQQLLDALAENDINRARNPQGKNFDVISLFQITMTERSYNAAGKRVFKQDDVTGQIMPEDTDHLIVPPITIQSTNTTLLSCLQNVFTIENHPKEETLVRATALLCPSNYFLIRLKRTQWDRATGRPVKNEQPISFPLENFDISALSLSDDTKFPLYRCTAVIMHAGVATGGHYTAYVRRGNEWYFCNDTQIIPISLQKIRDFADRGAIDGRTALMFFYEQQ